MEPLKKKFISKVTPKSLANLRAWTGPDGDNPAPKRTTAGASVRQWTNALVQRTVPELIVIADDPKSPAAKVLAAKRILAAASRKRGLGDWVAVIEQTDGKPKGEAEAGQVHIHFGRELKVE